MALKEIVAVFVEVDPSAVRVPQNPTLSNRIAVGCLPGFTPGCRPFCTKVHIGCDLTHHLGGVERFIVRMQRHEATPRRQIVP